MEFSRGVIRKKTKIMYNNNLLDVCNEFVYLGIKLNCNGSLKKGLEYLSHQANNAMFSLLSKVRKLSLTIDTAMHLFECTVLPILLYGCEIWGHEDIKAANTLYLRFYKILLGLKKSSNTCLILGELGKLPLRSIINKRMIYFWAKLVLDDQHKLSGNILKWITTLKTNSGWCPSWLNFIHNTLDMAGLSQMWCTPNIFSANYIKKYFNLRSTDIAKQSWKSDVNNSSKCTIYKLIDKELVFENYLINLPWAVASTLCKFRTSNHPLPIETGRYTNTLRDNRLCLLCNKNLVGDEYHYVMVCDHFSDIRTKYISIDENLSKLNVFKKLLLSNDRGELIRLSLFLKTIFKHF